MSAPDFFRSRLAPMIDLRHPLAMLSTRLPWTAIEAAVAPKLAHPAKPTKRVIGEDLAGAFDGEFGGGISPAGRPRLPIRLMVSLLAPSSATAKKALRAARTGGGVHLQRQSPQPL